jgi:hypothetical protein
MGDGTVLARVMRAMQQRFPRFPLYIAGKEISLEDIRLTLDKIRHMVPGHLVSMIDTYRLYQTYSVNP